MPLTPLDRPSLLAWLQEEDEARLVELWREADRVRLEHVGNEVHLRGLIEISNYCVRSCAYCGIRRDNRAVSRYRMSAEEILGCAREAVGHGYGTVVLQAGEDYGIQTDWISEQIRAIKRETGLAVTLSLGERPEADLRAWREAGADRYLLRFETSDERLYRRIHPDLPGKVSDRLAILQQLGRLGYEVGSGVMVGIPGQSYESLADDLLLFGNLDLDMIGIGPYIPHPQTPLGEHPEAYRLPAPQQVPNSEAMVYRAVALTRLLCPEANIPSTTALATLNQAQGRELGLLRGANIVMPNLTPPAYRVKYEIYPGKACISETAAQCAGCLARRIEAIGRKPGRGAGGRRRKP